VRSREFEISRATILVITANPGLGDPGGGELALDQEIADIQRELLLAPHHDFELIPASAATVDDVMRLLNKLKPVAVHFAGHGVAGGRGAAGARRRDFQAVAIGGDAGIILLDEHGNPQLVTADALAKMIASAAPAVRWLLLNACYSEAQAGVLSGVVDAVITMNGAIRDDSARSFAAAFYRALGHRRPLGVAFSQAQATLAGKGCPDEDLPRLHTRNGVRADDIVLADAPAPPRFRLRRPELDTRRFRQLVRHKAPRRYLVGIAVAAAMIAAAAALTSLATTGHGVNEPHDEAPAPKSAPSPVCDRSEIGPSTIPPPPCPRVDSLPRPTTEGESQGHAPGVNGTQPQAPPHKPRPAPRPPQLGAAPAKPPQLDAAPAKPPQLDAAPAKPKRLDDTGALGELDREIVLRYIGYHLDQMRHCYEVQRMAKPGLTGKILARFDITPAGGVASATAIGLDSAVDSCVADVLKDIEFPRSGAGVHINYLFNFQPEGALSAPCSTTADGSCPARAS
jgi:CHAT domain-containing protein